MQMYVVNFSTGLTSWEALRRCLATHGTAQTVAVFADVKGHSDSPHLGEDADNYRFLEETERHFGIEIVRIVEGRDIWQVMQDKRCITLLQYAPCSKILKRDPADAWVAEHYPDAVRVFGMDWTEVDRMERLRAEMGDKVWFPLAEAPYVDKCHIAAELERIGIKPPAMYEQGFEHANCGGFCVKAGQAHFARLLQVNPERYLYHEGREQELRDYLGKDIAVLKDRTGGEIKTLTLHDFREQVERGEKYDRLDWGGCGCFAPVQQLRMDDLVLEASK